jgi:hypothetical protein
MFVVEQWRSSQSGFGAGNGIRGSRRGFEANYVREVFQ